MLLLKGVDGLTDHFATFFNALMHPSVENKHNYRNHFILFMPPSMVAVAWLSAVRSLEYLLRANPSSSPNLLSNYACAEIRARYS
jgi:hypothetical protein